MVFGRPMIVAPGGGCRSADYNRLLNPPGHPRSLHLMQSPHGLAGTAAIDVRVPPQDRMPLVILACERGWSVGVARSFIHLDCRFLAGLPQRMFGY